jgi:acyl-CoA thioester hydrolase
VTTELRLKRRVLFYETDAAGIVHFSWYFRYMEEAEHALWRAAGLKIHAAASDVGWPRVAATCEYHRALYFEDEFEVAIRITELARRTISYTCVIDRGEDRIATGTLKVACVSSKPGEPMRSTEIPQEIADRFRT